jgi:alpha-beta hydrolase superfamily lysophospholipase
MHPLAQALLMAGFAVDVIDVRGHGDSGTRGQIGYIGQLEDDLADFMQNRPFAGPSTLMGFSAGGGFVLRFAASAQAALFDRYVLLSPFLLQASSNRPNGGGWASVGVPRIVALTLLNKIGITTWNDLPATQFALNAEAAKFLTTGYSFALAANFGAHRDYAQDIARAPAALKLVAGTDDELMFSERYAQVFASAGKTVPITLVPGANHIGVTVNPAALAAIVAICQ